jgi:solute carrier family 35 protein
MNIPMYNAMRRCVPIANLLLGVLFLRIRPTRGITLSVLTITAGTLVAAFGDLNFDSTAYTFGAISVISNAAYLTTLQKTGMEKNLGAISIAYINRLLITLNQKIYSNISSINCMPVMTLVLFITGDIPKERFQHAKNVDKRLKNHQKKKLRFKPQKQIVAYPHWSSSSFIFAFLAVIFSGCIFTYSMFLCTTVNSALTTSCVSGKSFIITRSFAWCF